MAMITERISIDSGKIQNFILQFILLTLLLPFHAEAAANYTLGMISDPTYGIIDRNPVLDNTGRVAWEQKRPNPDGWSYSSGIHLYDGGTHTFLGDYTHENVGPTLSDSGSLVWRDRTTREIKQYSNSSTQTIGSYLAYTDQAVSRDGKVAWYYADSSSGSSNNAFYLYYHGTTNVSPNAGYFDYPAYTIYKPYGNASGAYAPKVNNAGQTVWMGGVYDQEIFVYDSAAGTISNISNRSFDDYYPDINDSGEIVWYGVTSTDTGYPYGYPTEADLFYYNGSAVQSITGNPVSTSGGYSAPLINNNGQIAYVGPDTDPGGTDLEVFLYDIASGTTLQITHDDIWQPFYLSMNDYGQLAWVGVAKDLSTDDEVFVWDGSVVQQLTHDDGNALNTSINNLGQVVWENYDTNPSNQDWEVWLATPTAVPEPGSLLLIASGITLLSLRRSRNGS